ncbi:hypothetical protein [Sphingomonas sp.]|uniref:hypothetical protein n=1 Tax=Sphingomonas sp. TaxID=28214 RepID=UPI00286BD38E|nr:hypothetical protein [Sphingomonas sp.]
MIGSITMWAAAVSASFHCNADAPQMLTGEMASPKLTEIGLPPEAANRSFDVRIQTKDDVPRVEVTWPNDAMRLTERLMPAFETAEGSYAFTSYSVGPCLFTDKGCVSQFSIVDRGEKNGKADLLIVPAGLTSDPKSGKKTLMTIIMRGTCERTDLKR